MTRKNQRGNALFIVLLGVVLFAALAFSLTRSGREKTSTSQEEVAMGVNSMMAWAHGVSVFVENAMVESNIQDWEFSVQRYAVASPDECGGKSACTIFNGIKIETFPAKLFTAAQLAPFPSSQFLFKTVRVKGVGNDARADVYLVIKGLTETACRAVNRKLGLTNTYPSDSFNFDVWPTTGKAVLEPAAGANSDIGDQVAELTGKSDFCIQDTTNSSYMHLLIAR
jgi:hypothetical protein